MSEARAQEILEFWFGDLDQTPDYFKERNKLWFMGGDEVDERIRRDFERDVIQAVEGKLAHWAETPKGCMALIILLDQFSLNLYREMPRSYRQSELAIPLTHRILERGWEYALTPAERIFAYLPLEHSESLEDQEQCVELYRRLASGAPPALKETMDGYLEYAVRHWRVVKKYGRFPDRNEVFGRESLPEELAFLASDQAPF